MDTQTLQFVAGAFGITGKQQCTLINSYGSRLCSHSRQICTPCEYEPEYWFMPHTFEGDSCTWCCMLRSDPDASITGCAGGGAGKYAMCGT